ncbi:MAG: dihydrodipicolinate synthase family protein [Candidatus Brocadiia bacterium]|nr:MAG: dihydrodipicolinate synthase family protein [Candidatus Brocadiia bacterium]
MVKPKKYNGVVVPMATPFTQNGSIDIPAAEKIIEFLVNNKCSPFVLGTTGEAASVPDDQRAEFVEATVKQTAKRVKTYAGIASNCISNSIELAKKYFDLGIDAAVAHLPSYYPLTDSHMLKYYENLAEKVPGPLMVYNITITTHMSIPLDVIDKLSKHPNIVGLKDSEKNVERMHQSLALWKDRQDFVHLVGCAALSAEALLAGSDGIVPSTANFVPKMFYDLYKAGIKGDAENANRLQKETDELAKIYQKDRILSQSLAAMKAIMSEMGLCTDMVLPPLCRVSDAEKAQIREQLKKAGIV